jgi:DNA-3-methyladenine glycosylase I
VLSRELVKRGFRFVGPTICYAFMQSVGMVNDHLVGCFRRAVVRRLGTERALNKIGKTLEHPRA